jgi:PAS domain S-box-containing protein
MGIPLRVLIVEDSEDDALLLVRVLRRSGYDLTYERVDTAAAMSVALETYTWDIIIADYTMPDFNGLAALSLMQAKHLDLPFIVVSGSIGEDLAVAAMKAGAHDYIMKGYLARLIPAVERELREAEVRRARRRAEETLQESYQLLHAVFAGTADAIFVKDLEGRYIMMNPAGAEALGRSPAEIMGKHDADLYAPETAHSTMDHDRRVIRSGETYTFEEVATIGDVTRTYLSTRTPHQDHQGKIIGVIGVARDITDRKQSEEEMRRQRETLYQSEKLATMGQLLAGVAHELNNPLSVVMGQASLLRQSIRSKRQIERAEKIVHAAERCARIVNNFLALARQRPPERHPLQLNQVVREAVELLAYQLRIDSVEVSFELAEELPVLHGDPHQLHQVVVNLVSNAHQAMWETPAPRRLWLATGQDVDSQHVWLEIRDSGPGIASEIQVRIFEPFFTTKPPGVGTGLGLSLCHGIVESHGGHISVKSAAGQGATFRIELPLAGVEEALILRPEVTVSPVIRGKRILVVDDEPGISGVVAEVLQLDGHVVDMVENGAEALRRVLEQSFDVILSDIRMPELDGPGLYREIEQRDPRLLQRMIFLTGDTLSPGTRDFLEQTGVPCLSKPFALGEIREIVQRVLQVQQDQLPGDPDLASSQAQQLS